MFQYIPNTDEDIKYMLDYLKMDSIDSLFQDIPESLKIKGELNINSPLSELEATKYLEKLASKNSSSNDLLCFLGAGTYDHFCPAHVKHLISRGEFYTAYTPYQPEISQGTLQAIFEFQTMISSLTGMEAANASMYDGPTSCAEAAFLAVRSQKGNTILVSETVHPETRKIIETYMKYLNVNVKLIKSKDGTVDTNHLAELISKDTLGVVLQSPNFFGVIEDYSSGLSELCKSNKALMIVSSDPIALSLIKTPSEYGADVAVGEGQPLGNPMNYGGPHVGYFAVTKKLMRKMPGRVVGQTTDVDGKRGFVLTLQAREQHIRREKATSNICSNQALNALTATIYMASMGKKGLTEAAAQTVDKSYYVYNKLIETGLFKPVFDKPFFREFVVKSSVDISKLNKKLLDKGILGGLDLSKYYPDKNNELLICVTEKRTKEELDYFVQVMKEAADEL